MSDKDVRYQRTKVSILDAMIRLLSEKNFDQVTVKSICEEAKISRSGFYLHYTDKYDLVEKYQLELMSKSVAIFSINIKKSKSELMLNALTFFKNEGQLLGLLISENGSIEVKMKVKAMLKENARQNILPQLDIRVKNKIHENYLLSFFSSAVIGVFQEWIDSGQKESPEEIVAILEQILLFDLWKEEV